MKPKSVKIVRVIATVYTLLLIGISLLPSGTNLVGGWDTAISPGLQNMLHVPAYIALVILAFLALCPSLNVHLTGMVLLSLSCCIFGMTLEFVQIAIPGRTGSLTDAMLNIIGVIIGSLMIITIRWRGMVRRGEQMRVQVDCLENERGI